MSESDTVFSSENIMSDYWYSRGLLVAGMLIAIHCPFQMLLLPIALLIDLFYHNPVLPMNIGLRPQELAVRLVLWLRERYAELVLLYHQFFLKDKDKQKKRE